MLKTAIAHADLYKVYGDKESLKIIKDCGFDGVDYGLNAFQYEDDFILLKSDEEIKAYFTDVKEYCASIGLDIAHTHSPYYFAMEADKFFEEHYQNIFKNAIKATHYLGVDTIVIHAIVLPDHENNYKKNRDINVAFYTGLLPTMKEYGVKVAVENMDALDPVKKVSGPSPISSAEKILDLIDHLNDDMFVACFDTGHAYAASQEPSHMLELLGDKTKVLHLHDNDGLDDLHLPPTFGQINWNKFCKTLKETGFSGYVNMEVNLFHTGENNMKEMCALLSAIARMFVNKAK